MEKGFTLIELMIALAIASIALTVAVPSMSGFINSNRQAGAVNEFLSSLYLARDEALTRNLAVTICPSSSGDDCEAVSWEQGRLVFVDQDGDLSLDAGEPVLETGSALPAGMSVRSREFTTALIYRPNGRVRAADVATNSGSFRFCSNGDDKHARIAAIDFSGRPEAKLVTGDGVAALCSS